MNLDGKCFLLCVVVGLGIGCGKPQIYSKTFPGMDIASVERVYVQEYPEADERGKGVGAKIAEALQAMGVAVSSGPDFERPDETRVIVTYRDHWFWDISMYIYDLTIYVRDLDSDWIMASGGSQRMSLQRKEADVMAREILEPIFGSSRHASE